MNRNVTLAKIVAIPIVPLILGFRGLRFLILGFFELAYGLLYHQMMSEEEIIRVNLEKEKRSADRLPCEKEWSVEWDQFFLTFLSCFIFFVCIASDTPLAIYGWALFFANFYRVSIWLGRLYNKAYYSTFGKEK